MFAVTNIISAHRLLKMEGLTLIFCPRRISDRLNISETTNNWDGGLFLGKYILDLASSRNRKKNKL